MEVGNANTHAPSGSIDENSTQIYGHEIKKDELYVIDGNSLIKAYKLMASQRTSALVHINGLSPTYTKEIESYMILFTHVNKTMYEFLNAIPYKKLKEMEEEEHGKNKRIDLNQEKRKELTNTGENFTQFMKDFLKKNKISLNGDVNDGNKEDTSPPNTPITPNDTVN